jgi:hypothetical protein
MSIGQQLLVPVTFVLYVAAIQWLLFKGRPFVAGLASLLISLIPLGWQVLFTDSEAYGYGILLLLMAPLPLLLMVVGFTAAVVRLIRTRVNSPTSDPTGPVL